ncbi:MAG: hypothetical protein NWF04_02485 [Candidatus Bathyarchaeota archaeon]|nr:hypothetical protein [Candidatus Bathyarchaeota archaeon]
MGWGSAGTPPWVDEKAITAEKRQKALEEAEAKIKVLQEENTALKQQIEKLQKQIQELKK